MSITYQETQKNHTLREFVEPIEKERAAVKQRLIDDYKKRLVELCDSTEKDSPRQIEYYQTILRRLTK